MSSELPGQDLQQQGPCTSGSLHRRKTCGTARGGILKLQFQARSEGNLSMQDDDEDFLNNLQNPKKHVKFIASPTYPGKIPSNHLASLAVRERTGMQVILNSRGLRKRSFGFSHGSALNRQAEVEKKRRLIRVNPYLKCDFYQVNIFRFRCKCRRCQSLGTICQAQSKNIDQYQPVVRAHPSNYDKEPHLCRLWNFLLATNYPRQPLFRNELELTHLPQKEFYLLLMYLSTFTTCLAYKDFSASASPSAAEYKVLREMTARFAKATDFPKTLRDSYLRDPMNSAKELFCQFFSHLVDLAEEKSRTEAEVNSHDGLQ